MASSKEYLDFILEQLSKLDDITYRAMMGEYRLYIIVGCGVRKHWNKFIFGRKI